MNRRIFLKGAAGVALGVAATAMAIPASARVRLFGPVSGLVASRFLDKRIKRNIRRLKQQNPRLVIGETHCHSTFSDGAFPVESLMVRAAALGLDFLVITEHLMPRKHLLTQSLLSFEERWRQFRQWDHGHLKPVTVYPAFEISTEQGHLILVFPEEYLNPKNYPDITRNFSRFDTEMGPMELPARLAKSLGGIAIIPHPEVERPYPFGASVSLVRRHLLGLVDGIEDISTGHAYEENYSAELGLAAIGSSDDHLNLILGTAVTGYDSASHTDLLSAIQSRATRAIKVEDSLTPLFAGLRKLL